jgi:hypothetical protein
MNGWISVRSQVFVELPAFALPNRSMRPLEALVPKVLPDMTPAFWPKPNKAASSAAATPSN